MADYSSITNKLIASLTQEGYERQQTIDMVSHAHRIGLMTKEELEEDVKRRIGEILKGVVESISKDCSEEEKADE